MTTASQPVTGKTSAVLVVVHEPDQLLELLEVEVGLALVGGQLDCGSVVSALIPGQGGGADGDWATVPDTAWSICA